MRNRLSLRIKNIKNELLNLKTAHDRGLGMATFFYNTVPWIPSSTSEHTIRIQAVFSNPTASGITQMGLPTEDGFVFGALVGLNSYPGGAYIDMTATCDETANFTIISSEGIQSLTVTELL